MSTSEDRRAAWAELRAQSYETVLARHVVPPSPSPAPSLPTPIADIERTIAEHKSLADARMEAIGMALGEERARHRKTVEALEARIDGLTLRVDALAHEAGKRIDAAERREHDDSVVPLPVFLRRHA